MTITGLLVGCWIVGHRWKAAFKFQMQFKQCLRCGEKRIVSPDNLPKRLKKWILQD